MMYVLHRRRAHSRIECANVPVALGLLALLAAQAAAASAYGRAYDAAPPADAAGQAQDRARIQLEIDSQAAQAVVLEAQGRFVEALPIRQASLALAERALPPDDAVIADLLNAVGELHRFLGHPKEAEPAYRRSLAIYEKISGPGDANVAKLASNLGMVVEGTARYDEAQALFRRALAINERLYGPDDARVANNLFHLAAVLEATGQHAEAETLYRRTLVINEKVYGSQNPIVATILNNLANLLHETGRDADAEAMYRRAIAIDEQLLGTDNVRVATKLNGLATVLKDMGRYTEAEPLYRRALAIFEGKYGPVHDTVARNVGNLAQLLLATGRYAEAEPLDRRALAIDEQIHGTEDPRTAVDVNNLAALLTTMGRYGEAEPLYRRDLAFREKTYGPQDIHVAIPLSNLAYLLDLTGRDREAEPLYRRALAIQEKAYGPQDSHLAITLNNLSSVLETSGRYAEAELLLRRSRAIQEARLGPEHPSVAICLSNLAQLMMVTGRLPEAEPLLRRAVAIFEKAYGPDNAAVANPLNALAILLKRTGRFADAEPLLRHALAIKEQALGSDHPEVGRVLDNLAIVVQHTTGPAQAEPIFRRALEITEKAYGPDDPHVGVGLLNLALLLAGTGRDTQAQAALARAYRIARSAGDAQLAWSVPSGMMDYYQQAKPRKLALAIFYGKEAVNALQRLRVNLRDSATATQASFADSVAPTYRQLAHLLIQDGRLAEAQQVLAMLKEQEFYDFNQRGGDADTRSTVAGLNASEQELESLNGRLVSLGKEYGALQEQYRQQGDKFSGANHDTPAYRRMVDLRKEMEAARIAFDAHIEAIAQQAQDPEAQRRRRDAIRDFGRSFQGTVKRLGHDAVLVQYFILEDKVEILLTTPYVVLAREAPVKREDLNEQIGAYRITLTNPTADPLPQAQALYRLLIGPIADDLRQAGAKILMLSLDDALRYVPFAALHDGKGYLNESYSLAMVNEATRDKLDKAPNTDWSVWGLGVTQAHVTPDQEHFEPLPMVGQELAAIAGPRGILAGKIMLDQQFNENSLRDGLDQPYPIVHIASHFKFSPVSKDASFLLLGDGSQMSLMQFQGLDFRDVELLALSACETALGGEGAGRHGTEVESLGVIAQEGGAKAVLATLWPVADSSTALLMRTFYEAHKTAQMNKADALREAQLALLRGSARVESLPEGERGARVVGRVAPAVGTFKRDPAAPFAHPYFWAPFILMGNWQ
jgi:CHAT domain-containing protein/Flp pilus assembly protein TadD